MLCWLCTKVRHNISELQYSNSNPIIARNISNIYESIVRASRDPALLEFANSQLLQYRYYDQRLDDELRRIYARLQVTRWYEPWVGRRYTAAARELHALFIDVNELIAPARLDGQRTPAARYINHSRMPNADAAMTETGDIYLFALRPIAGCRGGQLGEEITIDYRRFLNLTCRSN